MLHPSVRLSGKSVKSAAWCLKSGAKRSYNAACNVTSLKSSQNWNPLASKGVPEPCVLVGKHEEKLGLETRSSIEAKQRHAEALAKSKSDAHAAS
jgi:hypothetical protein